MKRTYKLFTVFALTILVANIAKAQEVIHDEEADMACFLIMYQEGLTGEEFDKGWPICLKAAETGARGAQIWLAWFILRTMKGKKLSIGSQKLLRMDILLHKTN